MLNLYDKIMQSSSKCKRKNFFLVENDLYKKKLALYINLRNRLAKTFTLIYVPRTSATLLEINGAKIPPNKPAPIVLRRDRLVEAESDTELVYASTDHVFASDGLRFEVNFGGEKSLKGIFQRDVRWGLECELIGLNMLMQISVVTDQGVLIRERVKLRRNRFCQKLSVIQEDEEEEMHGIDDGNEVGNKGASWAINIGILVASLGVGFFIFRAPLKSLKSEFNVLDDFRLNFVNLKRANLIECYIAYVGRLQFYISREKFEFIGQLQFNFDNITFLSYEYDRKKEIIF
ncbi:hypothetical protein IEQ34_011436 [Dendrobium chrysotoxum]|uniref:Uncharacterized protein n=1 Tax=Dendrobium chrysotoxum TaxID=161865 RepID=A0AAV7GQJ8_DENCH|nr:hypothetical protein IEQ34_011436 [Dendrobium chrysotoxum]